jgi:stage V sporulation protein B
MSDDSDSGLDTLAREGGITLLGNVLGKALRFAFVMLATRWFSKGVYGVFTLGLSIVLFAQGVSNANLHKAIDYHVPDYLSDGHHNKARGVLVTVVSSSIVLSIAVAGAITILSPTIAATFDKPQLAEILPVLSIVIVFGVINKSLITTYASIKNLKFRVYTNDLLNPIVRTLVAGSLLIAGYELFGLIAGYIAGVLAAMLLGVWLLLKSTEWINRGEIDPPTVRSLLTYSLPLLFAGVLYTVVAQVDYFVIGWYMRSEDVATYRVNYLLASQVILVISAAAPIFKTQLSENRDDREGLRIRYQQATRWITMLTIPIVITLVSAPNTYVGFLFTQKYATAAMTVIMLCGGYLFVAAIGPDGAILQGLGSTRLNLLNTAILMVTNVSIDILLVPRLGILGAAVGTACGFIASGTAGVVQIFWLRQIHPYTWQFVRTTVAAVPSLLLGMSYARYVERTIIIVFSLPVIVVIAYVLSLRLSGGFTEIDRTIASKFDDYIGMRLLSRIL